MKKIKYLIAVFFWAAAFVTIPAVSESPSSFKPKFASSLIVPLNGPDWKLATDADNKGREEKWYEKSRTETKSTMFLACVVTVVAQQPATITAHADKPGATMPSSLQTADNPLPSARIVWRMTSDEVAGKQLFALKANGPK